MTHVQKLDYVDGNTNVRYNGEGRGRGGIRRENSPSSYFLRVSFFEGPKLNVNTLDTPPHSVHIYASMLMRAR